jgi:hypothetical protein
MLIYANDQESETRTASLIYKKAPSKRGLSKRLDRAGISIVLLHARRMTALRQRLVWNIQSAKAVH